MRAVARFAFGIALAVAFAACALDAAATKMDVPADVALDSRLKRLENELRCLVCQNQTLADSNASLAEDLRGEVRELALAGKSDDEIRAYLVARYGDFVLYDPPLKRTTWLLWLGPFALLAGGGGLWWTILRRRELAARSMAPAADPAAEARGRALLDNNDTAPDASSPP
jgi:cytochrome c-type biogenesis protein CcmH